jgi:hypothetical protein
LTVQHFAVVDDGVGKVRLAQALLRDVNAAQCCPKKVNRSVERPHSEDKSDQLKAT